MTELLAKFFAQDFTNIMGSVFSNELGGHDGGRYGLQGLARRTSYYWRWAPRARRLRCACCGSLNLYGGPSQAIVSPSSWTGRCLTTVSLIAGPVRPFLPSGTEFSSIEKLAIGLPGAILDLQSHHKCTSRRQISAIQQLHAHK